MTSTDTPPEVQRAAHQLVLDRMKVKTEHAKFSLQNAALGRNVPVDTESVVIPREVEAPLPQKTQPVEITIKQEPVVIQQDPVIIKQEQSQTRDATSDTTSNATTESQPAAKISNWAKGALGATAASVALGLAGLAGYGLKDDPEPPAEAPITKPAEAPGPAPTPLFYQSPFQYLEDNGGHLPS